MQSSENVLRDKSTFEFDVFEVTNRATTKYIGLSGFLWKFSHVRNSGAKRKASKISRR